MKPNSSDWLVEGPEGGFRVVVTKQLPGERWLEVLRQADCRVEVCRTSHVLSTAEITEAIGERCDACIGQLTEPWGEELFGVLAEAGGRVYSNYAVGHDNVDVESATRLGIAVGNTPGVLTETTAQLAVALTFAAARRVPEGDRLMRDGEFAGWLPDLLLGKLLWRKRLGIVGAGRIGAAYARMMVEGHKMDLLYYDPVANSALEQYVDDYNKFLEARGEPAVSCRRCDTLEELLRESDVVSLHVALNEGTRHLLNGERLAVMKEDAVLVNTSRGPLIDESALVVHCAAHPDFRAGLDVYEEEPAMHAGLANLPNVVLLPHLGSATTWTRSGMALLAALNVVGVLSGWPVWSKDDMSRFLQDDPSPLTPSIVNAKDLGLTED